jgi:predicted DNA binding CopG/RHH family protein
MPKREKTSSKSRTPRKAHAPAVPRFDAEAEERAFWQEHDTADYVDWSQAERVRLPKLKPSTATISLRLPKGMLEELKVLANQRDVPYQTLLKVFLAERLAAERDRKRRAS